MAQRIGDNTPSSCPHLVTDDRHRFQFRRNLNQYHRRRKLSNSFPTNDCQSTLPINSTVPGLTRKNKILLAFYPNLQIECCGSTVRRPRERSVLVGSNTSKLFVVICPSRQCKQGKTLFSSVAFIFSMLPIDEKGENAFENIIVGVHHQRLDHGVVLWF